MSYQVLLPFIKISLLFQQVHVVLQAVSPLPELKVHQVQISEACSVVLFQMQLYPSAALDKTYTDEFTRHTSSTSYDKIYIGRANVSSDEAFGFLPGELEDKTRPLLLIYIINNFP